MIPLMSSIKTKSFPIVNWLIIALNSYVFFVELKLGHDGKALERFIYHWGVTPSHLIPHPPYLLGYTVVTAMFVHGGWMHIIFNMLFLLIFGRSVEDAQGTFPVSVFLSHYRNCGKRGSSVFIEREFDASHPGASGAIAGVLGAYFFYYPHSKIMTAIPILFFITVREDSCLCIPGALVCSTGFI